MKRKRYSLLVWTEHPCVGSFQIFGKPHLKSDVSNSPEWRQEFQEARRKQYKVLGILSGNGLAFK